MTKHNLSPKEYLEETKKRFMKHVQLPENLEECWIWTGARKYDGYGFFNAFGKLRLAHRVSYKMFIGDFSDSFLVLHRCDNPPCVNPKHLFLGTPKDNVLDMIEKNRHSKTRSMKRVTEDNIYKIMYLYRHGWSKLKIASYLDIPPSTIRSIIDRLQLTK